jgi:hypothetical protein
MTLAIFFSIAPSGSCLVAYFGPREDSEIWTIGSTCVSIQLQYAETES